MELMSEGHISKLFQNSTGLGSDRVEQWSWSTCGAAGGDGEHQSKRPKGPPCPLVLVLHYCDQHSLVLLVLFLIFIGSSISQTSLSTCPCPGLPCPPSQLQLLVTGISQVDLSSISLSYNPQSTIILFFPYNGLRSTSSKVHLTIDPRQQMMITFILNSEISKDGKVKHFNSATDLMNGRTQISNQEIALMKL